MEIDLRPGAPACPERTLQLAETIAACVRCLNHATRWPEALEYPAEADRAVRSLETAAAGLDQLLSQVSRHVAAWHAAGRIEVPGGEWQGRPGIAVTALQARLDAARATAMALWADLEHAAQVTSALALREEREDD